MNDGRSLSGLPVVLLPLMVSMMQFGEKHEPASRDLDSYEIFSGEAWITQNCRKKGLKAACLDKRYEKDVGIFQQGDIMTTAGLDKCLKTILRIRPWGSLWGAPRCDPWIFICRNGTARTKVNPGGDTNVPRVKQANQLVMLTVTAYVLAWIRNVNIWHEQPPSSLMTCPDEF